MARPIEVRLFSRFVFSSYLLGALAFGTVALPAYAASALPPPYEDLIHVKSKKLDAVYLLPGADFSAYSKVMIEPVQVSFRKDWVKETNRSRGLSSRIDEDDAQRIAQAARSGFEDVFVAAFKSKGYEVVTSPARGVLRLSPAIVNLYINAPQQSGPGISRSYTVEAGGATLVLEARDSITGAVLGVAIDRSETRGSGYATLTTSGSNRADFEQLFKRWADICVKGFEQLRATPVAQRPTVDKGK